MDALLAEVGAGRSDLYFIDGWLAIKEKNYAHAEASLEKSLQLSPSPDAVFLLAGVMGNDGNRVKETASFLQKWIAEYPRDQRLMAFLGQLYLSDQDYGNATASFERLLELSPDSILALNNLAWLVRDTNPDGALAYARKAHELAPQNPVVLDTYGSLLAANGEFDSAAAMLSDAVRLQPDNMGYKLRYGEVLLRVGDGQEGITMLEKVVNNASDAELVAEARKLLVSQAGAG